jgi:hypothetical protein
MGSNPIHHDVGGAPFRIGERVHILSSKDETLDHRFVGRIGSVKYLEYECGCGQTYPHDPMIGVEFRDRKTEEFWKDELGSFRPRSAKPVDAATKETNKP